MNQFLALDIGGTKVGWGIFDADLRLSDHGRFANPGELDSLLEQITTLATTHEVSAVSMGVAGTHNKEGDTILASPNIPYLRGVALAKLVGEKLPEVIVTLDNDARCALVGEVIAGSAKTMQNAVLITIGTGIGGAVLQRGTVLPHPQDITQEVGHLIADSTDAFTPLSSTRGSIEALLGGRNLESRFDISLATLAEDAKNNSADARELWGQIQMYTHNCFLAIHHTYSCEAIIVGGVGGNDLALYIGELETPCRVLKADLGELAALYGAGQLALDSWHDSQKSSEKWV